MVVDVPYGLRGGIPEYGGRFAAQALVMATADGHPRAIAYVSRIPTPTLDAIKRNAFYTSLIRTQHFTFAPVTVPLTAAASAVRPLWARKLSSYTPPTAADVAAGRRAARRMHIGWVVVWYSNPAIVQYLHQTGFRFAYRADRRFGLPACPLTMSAGAGGLGPSRGGQVRTQRLAVKAASSQVTSAREPVRGRRRLAGRRKDQDPGPPGLSRAVPQWTRAPQLFRSFTFLRIPLEAFSYYYSVIPRALP